MIEIAVQDVAGAVTADELGADRIELCIALSLGGLTPSLGLITATREATESLEIAVLIRPRPGDFVYSPDEQDVILRDIDTAVDAGADAVVVGGLQYGLNGLSVDWPLLERMRAAARGCSLVFHRAIDEIRDPAATVAGLADHGVTRILTSGGESNAHAGAPAIARMVEAARGHIQIMAGGGVDIARIPELGRIGVDAIHLSAKRSVTVDSTVSLGSASRAGYTTRDATDPALVRRAVTAVRAIDRR